MNAPGMMLARGFADPVDDAQAAFRASLRALAQPGESIACRACGEHIDGLMPATAALLLALADQDTGVWGLSPTQAAWLRFHTGARCDARLGVADFVVGRAGEPMPDLPALNPGSEMSPEQSATLLIELPALRGGVLQHWMGPGIRESRAVSPQGLTAAFWQQWDDNHASFPMGVDVFLIHGDEVMGLPRTTRVRRAEPA